MSEEPERIERRGKTLTDPGWIHAAWTWGIADNFGESPDKGICQSTQPLLTAGFFMAR
jgi:hypothetical protein